MLCEYGENFVPERSVLRPLATPPKAFPGFVGTSGDLGMNDRLQLLEPLVEGPILGVVFLDDLLLLDDALDPAVVVDDDALLVQDFGHVVDFDKLVLETSGADFIAVLERHAKELPVRALHAPVFGRSKHQAVGPDFADRMTCTVDDIVSVCRVKPIAAKAVPELRKLLLLQSFEQHIAM